VLKLRRNSDHNPLKGRILSFSRSSGRDPLEEELKTFLAIKSGKVAWVLTLKSFRLHAFRGFCVLCAKETSFLEVPGTKEDLDHPIVGTRVHRSRVV
jgi:hypothetical protein